MTAQADTKPPPQNALFTDLGARVLQARKTRGLSRKALSEASGVSPRYLAQLEGGQGNISIALLDRIAGALGTPMASLIDGGDSLRSLFDRASPETQARVMDLLGATPAPAKAGRICLIGLRGAGKSTLGQALAKAVALPFVELNQRIEAQAEMPLAEIMALYGAEGYRQLEAQALQATLAEHDQLVLAVAGGIVSEAETFAALRHACHTVWIRARPEDHMARVRAQGDTRPMAGNPRAMAQLERLLEARAPLYAQAEAELETSGQTPDQSLSDLLALLHDKAFLPT